MKYMTAIILVLALTGCETAEPSLEPSPKPQLTRLAAPYPEPGDAVAGRAFVERNCSTCHAVAVTGASPYAPAPPLRTLHERYDVEGLAEAFAEGILVGHKGPKQMPEFVLTTEEIDDLIAYLKSFE